MNLFQKENSEKYEEYYKQITKGTLDELTDLAIKLNPEYDICFKKRENCTLKNGPKYDYGYYSSDSFYKMGEIKDV